MRLTKMTRNYLHFFLHNYPPQLFSMFEPNICKITHALKPQSLDSKFDQKSLIYLFEKYICQNRPKFAFAEQFKNGWLKLVISGKLNRLVDFMFSADIDVFICAFTKYIRDRRYTCEMYLNCNNIYYLWKTIIAEYNCGRDFIKRYVIFRNALGDEIYCSGSQILCKNTYFIYKVIGSIEQDSILILLKNCTTMIDIGVGYEHILNNKNQYYVPELHM